MEGKGGEQSGYAHRCSTKLDELVLCPEPDGDEQYVKTSYDNWRRARARYPRSPFLGTREYLRDGSRGEYIFQSYEQIAAKVDGLYSGLLNLGVQPVCSSFA